MLKQNSGFLLFLLLSKLQSFKSQNVRQDFKRLRTIGSLSFKVALKICLYPRHCNSNSLQRKYYCSASLNGNGDGMDGFRFIFIDCFRPSVGRVVQRKHVEEPQLSCSKTHSFLSKDKSKTEWSPNRGWGCYKSAFLYTDAAICCDNQKGCCSSCEIAAKYCTSNVQRRATNEITVWCLLIFNNSSKVQNGSNRPPNWI